MECLTENQLTGLLSGLDDEAAWLHLSECDVCAAIFHELASRTEEPLPRAGRFTRSRVLGRGPHGITWLAMDEQRQREVALKVMSTTLPAGWAHTLGPALEHPAITARLEVGTLEGRPFVTHAFVEGSSLEASLPLALEPTLRIFERVGAALSWAHQHGVLHGEVCPSNILLGAAGAQVTDFGVARAVRQAAPEGALTMRLGWLSPEERGGEEATARSDQWAFARSMWVALFGAPFRLEVPTSLVDATLVKALQRALAVEPSARFASIAQLVQVWR